LVTGYLGKQHLSSVTYVWNFFINCAAFKINLIISDKFTPRNTGLNEHFASISELTGNVIRQLPQASKVG
jgi:hypothetical protein